MRGLAIYLEGGGAGAGSKALLRRGMGEFLQGIRNLARAKRLNWKIVACGGRDQAFDRFRNSVINGDASVSLLLVDAEGSLQKGPRQHLIQRDHWDLGFASESVVQLMVQAMETWIIADPNSLADYYGKGFVGNALPAPGTDLEGLDRGRVEDLLQHSTRRTAKGEYRKIRDGSTLLARIDPEVVRGRCPSCKRLFETLEALIAQA